MTPPTPGGRTVRFDDIELYFEEYGSGMPLVNVPFTLDKAFTGALEVWNASSCDQFPAPPPDGARSKGGSVRCNARLAGPPAFTQTTADRQDTNSRSNLVDRYDRTLLELGRTEPEDSNDIPSDRFRHDVLGSHLDDAGTGGLGRSKQCREIQVV